MPHIKLTTNHAVQMRSASFTIGSDPTCDLPLTGKAVLPRHLILQSRGDGWQVATLAPRAYASLNGHPLASLALLKDGDQIQIGDVTLIWREQDLPPANASPWMGLLAIFLVVMIMLTGVLAWFGLTHGYRTENTDSPTPVIEPVQAIPTVMLEQPPLLEGYSEAEHPIYRIVIPTQ